MLLDVLKKFEWYNEPCRITYRDDVMDICTESQTDFWQSQQHQQHKDNGHFFFTHKDNNFCLNLHWKYEEYSGFRQCGAMVRIDERNWIKVGIMASENNKPKIGTVVTNRGNSDWATHDIIPNSNEIWFRIKRIKSDYIIFVSIDGEKFQQLRLCNFHAEHPEVKAGAYACSPQNISFICTLIELNID